MFISTTDVKPVFDFLNILYDLPKSLLIRNKVLHYWYEKVLPVQKGNSMKMSG